jgi:hypothetical protein
MESVTTTDLLELILASEQFIDDQIEFWLTVTFATIVASFAGDKLLTVRNRIIVSVLYILATFLFMSRWYYEFLDLTLYFELLVNRGVLLEAPLVTIFSRIALVVAGTLATLYFVNTRVERSDG